MEKWMIYAKKEDFDAIGSKFHISPVVARIIRNRDIIGEKETRFYLNGTIDQMYSPWMLKGMDEAVKIVQGKIKDKKRIRIVSDYDIDGICAAYILVCGLEELGAKVDLKIPNRVKDGYGISREIVESAYDRGINTLITCDNGIAAVEAIERAKELNMTVIVTDHHEVPFKKLWRGKEYIYPDADVIIDPKQPDCGYPFKEICGAVVAYKFLQALALQMGRKTESVAKYLEYAAIATIGDVVSLVDENRVIVKYGLKLLNETTNIGMNALIAACGLAGHRIDSYHVGFVIGPCLNAAGRLETARLAFDLLREKNMLKAKSQAEKLLELNEDRKKMTDEGVELARQDLETLAIYPVIVIYLPEVHESVAGIIAGRIRDLCYRPTIILTGKEDEVKGSGRSIEGYNMFEELGKCKMILTKFGGHAMAAGMSLKERDVNVLRRFLNRNINVDESVFTRKLWIDVAMPFEYASLELTDQLSVLEPFGKGNEKPSFGEKNISIVRMRMVGQNEDVVKLELTNSNDCRISAVYFDRTGEFRSYLMETYGQEEVDKALMGRPNAIRLSIIYYPQINEYRGSHKVEIVIKSYK